MKENKAKKAMLPKLAKTIGNSSIDSACALWFNQPKVPATMKKRSN